MGYASRRKHKTEHGGAKHAKGFWGRKKVAKLVSNKFRRANGKDEIADALNDPE
jgi:hypothetical protein